MTDPARHRRYRSPLRTEQARQTRLRILEAARELFRAQGYAPTTISTISKAAGVAPDTVYDAFRSKRGLLKELLGLSGTQHADDIRDHAMPGRVEPPAIRQETDQRRQIAMFAADASHQLERLRPLDDILRGAAATDREMAAFRENQQLGQRRQTMTTVALWISEHGPLRDGMPVDQAAAVIWTLTAPEVHHMLRVIWQWTAEQYETWLGRTLTDTLLPRSL
ncbi:MULTISPECIES: helix-turn-helix domain-containing protein [unclassified Frankia]|uniref:TetR/AcrR family transcriptional regulator n=1 Tax=unclassified Frankia TaxID=2632575 RepID=UPI002AD51255|nr:MULTISPECIES: helix-turn-helix domain-containing protein [unclassified Frankia]